MNEQLVLAPPPSDRRRWVLDENTRRVGRLGLHQARRVLAESRSRRPGGLQPPPGAHCAPAA